MGYYIKKSLFPLGLIFATRGVADMGIDVGPYLRRHVRGDWGDLCDEDKQLNEKALQDGERLLSCYNLENGRRIYIITERDRKVTTILLPEEY